MRFLNVSPSAPAVSSDLKQLASDVLSKALKAGATDAEAVVYEGDLLYPAKLEMGWRCDDASLDEKPISFKLSLKTCASVVTRLAIFFNPSAP